MIPGIRTIIPIPAGRSKMPIAPLLGWTFFGSLLWTALLFSLGYVLNANYDQVAQIIDPISTFFVGLRIAYVRNVLRRQSSNYDEILSTPLCVPAV
ncbi:hypothetical protein B9057_14270 (plasmid) [Aestuarium zhoushanense]|nr:hypothetical protein B9057_14270 [Aestuarium zhoushanense]